MAKDARRAGSGPVHIGRRGFLATGLGLFGLSSADILRARAEAPAGSAKRKSCIMIFLSGGLSHIDTFDMKPDAPREYRGEFRPIRTSAPGVQICEHLPRIARAAHHFSIVRSVTQIGEGVTGDHHAGFYYHYTGHTPDISFKIEGNGRRPKPTDWPNLGATVAYCKPSSAKIPQYIVLPTEEKFPGNTRPGQYGARLGVAYNPSFLEATRERPNEFHMPDTALPEGMTAGRLAARRHLLGDVDTVQNRFVRQAAPTSYDVYRKQAFELVGSREAKIAFDLGREPEKLRERYGHNVNGQSLLMARRLVEAGVPFVLINWVCPPPLNKTNLGFDTHADNFNELKNNLLPEFDRGLPALLDDLSGRGLLEDTVVYVTSEMGRTPKVGDPRSGGASGGGRDHWVQCQSVLLAGGGIVGGSVYGRTDRIAGYPEDGTVGPEDVASTVFRALGMPRDPEGRDPQGRPYGLMEKGNPIMPLFG